jgi:hypothetical protein
VREDLGYCTRRGVAIWKAPKESLGQVKQPNLTPPSKSTLQWNYGADATSDDIYVVDFHVVDKFEICPLILSSDLLYGTNAFMACAQDFFDKAELKSSANNESQRTKRPREEAEVFLVTKRGKWRDRFTNPFGRHSAAPISTYQD